MTATGAPPRPSDQDRLLGFIRSHVELHDRDFPTHAGWAYQSSFHLLLALGRRFTVAPRPHDLVGMPKRLCYGNSARYAMDRQKDGAVYAEGFASIDVGGTDFPLPHAWVVLPDGSALDPTWDDVSGRDYIGVPITDPKLWPVDGSGLFADPDKALVLLRYGLPEQAIADVGQPLM